MKNRMVGMTLALTMLGAALTLNAVPPGKSASQDIKALFNGKRAFNHIAALVDLGPKLAGGPAEKAAAAYIAAAMKSYGLEVEVQEFPVTFFEDFGSDLEVVGGSALNPVSMLYSPAGEFTAEMVYCELGQTNDFVGLDVNGKIVLMLRGVIPYSVKVANATAAGAAACVVFNSAPEVMNATLGSMAAIPAASLSGDEGALLLALLDEGPITVHFKVDVVHYDSTSQNVIGTRKGTHPDQGIVYMGAHYDSLWYGPGANDSSGIGCVLEAARVLGTKGHSTKATIKFIAFGAQEVGLQGSADYVLGKNLEEVTTQGLGMINLDQLAVGDTLLIGNIGWAGSELAAYAQEKAASMRIESWEAVAAASNNDHAYFEYVGVPAVHLIQSPDIWYHTPDNTLDKLNQAVLQATGELATAVVYDWAKNPSLRAKKAGTGVPVP